MVVAGRGRVSIPLFGSHRPDLAKARDERLHFRVVYITVYGKANRAMLGATHAQITPGKSKNKGRIRSAGRNLALI